MSLTAQLTWREGLRDIADCLNARPAARFHLGFCEPIAKSTLADANEKRNWRLWEDLAKNLMRKARRLYAGEDLGIELANTVYALDSTTIDLSLTLFPWADFRRTKAGLKLHTRKSTCAAPFRPASISPKPVSTTFSGSTS